MPPTRSRRNGHPGGTPSDMPRCSPSYSEVPPRTPKPRHPPQTLPSTPLVFCPGPVCDRPGRTYFRRHIPRPCEVGSKLELATKVLSPIRKTFPLFLSHFLILVSTL